MEQLLVRLRNIDGTEYVEVRGSLPMVEKLIRPYFADREFTVEGMSAITNNDAPALVQNTGASEMIVQSRQDESDLYSFYRKVAPTNQYEQITALTYFSQAERGTRGARQSDYQAAFDELMRHLIEPPKDLNSAVQNTVRRHKGIKPISDGLYALTDKGRELIRAKLQK